MLALHAYAKNVRLTHAEWRAALAFLHRTAAITSDSRSEFSLLSDVTGVSSLVDLMASAPGTTPGSVLGPFHTVGSPWLDNPANLVGANTGEVVVIRGRCAAPTASHCPRPRWTTGRTRPTACIGKSTRPNPRTTCAASCACDADGSFEIATIRPVPYEIPTDGPVWRDLVEPAGRTSWRSAHAHVIVSAPGYRTLVTELFDAEDPYLDKDAVFGVREALIGRYDTTREPDLCRRLGLTGDTCPVMRFDISLAPDTPLTVASDHT